MFIAWASFRNVTEICNDPHLYHGGNTIGTTCVVDRDDTAYMVVDREFRLPTE